MTMTNDGNMKSLDGAPYLAVRPYQLMCLFCALGEGDPGCRGERVRELFAAVRADPETPLALRCRSDDVFAYQSPGTGDDTPEGADYNQKRDLEILARLDLVPGSVLPARMALKRLLKAIPNASGICGYAAVTSEAWRGCAHAGSGAYERGREKGLDALIPPRSVEERARVKAATLKTMADAPAIMIRPHILLCAVAQFGNGVRPPFPEDNLPEMIAHILAHPDTPITLVRGADRMMCGPCPSRVARLNGCVVGNLASGGLYNELKDLNVLQALGLSYGDTLAASALYLRLFERIPQVDGVCALDRAIPAESFWREVCGQSDTTCPGYAKGREALMAAFMSADENLKKADGHV